MLNVNTFSAGGEEPGYQESHYQSPTAYKKSCQPWVSTVRGLNLFDEGSHGDEAADGLQARIAVPPPKGPEAFAAAQAEGKVILVSIGYSTCYWCRVMEQDSYEDEVLAEVLNRHFISIKVDREERPDVDKIHMDAVVAMRGQGGWPLNVFLTPDLKPLWGGTYFPRTQFLHILRQISTAWRKDPSKIERSGLNLTTSSRANFR